VDNFLGVNFMENKNYINHEQDRRLSVVEKHIETINSELGSIKVDTAETKKDVCWLKKTYWVVVSASIGAAIFGLANLLMK